MNDTQTLAGRGQRLIAVLIDAAVFLLPYGLIAAAKDSGAAAGIGGILVLIVIAAQLYLLAVNGQTIGKKAMGIKIVSATTGENAGIVPNILIRGLVNGVLNIVPFYGLVDALLIFRDDRRCIHDLLAGTKVVNA